MQPTNIGGFIYTDDRGRGFLVAVSRKYGEHPDLGFRPFSAVPGARSTSGFTMRVVHLRKVETGSRLSVPVGSPDAPVWQAPQRPIQLRRPFGGQTGTYLVTGYTGERWRWSS